MSLYSYVVKTPFNQMAADWNEYCDLREKAKLLRGERDFRHKQISEKCDGVDIKCIHKEKTGEQRLFRPVYSAHYCEEFFGGVCDGFCPRGFQHDRYWKQHDELKAVQNALDGFWNRKFQNVK